MIECFQHSNYKRNNVVNLNHYMISYRTSWAGIFSITRYPNNYRLIIQNIRKEDQGVYVCQIASFPPKALTVNINVIGKLDLHFISIAYLFFYLIFVKTLKNFYLTLFICLLLWISASQGCIKSKNVCLKGMAIYGNSIAINVMNLHSSIWNNNSCIIHWFQHYTAKTWFSNLKSLSMNCIIS